MIDALRKRTAEQQRQLIMKQRVAMWWHKNNCPNCMHGQNPVQQLMERLRAVGGMLEIPLRSDDEPKGGEGMH